MKLDLARNNIRDDGCRHLAVALERNLTLTMLNLPDNNFRTNRHGAFQTVLQSNRTLVKLGGVDGVEPLLARNREIRNARECKVWWCRFCVAD